MEDVFFMTESNQESPEEMRHASGYGIREQAQRASFTRIISKIR